jgi:hypothetical protein
MRIASAARARNADLWSYNGSKQTNPCLSLCNALKSAVQQSTTMLRVAKSPTLQQKHL